MGYFAYVTNIRSNSVSVLDTATNAVVATPPLHGSPVQIALTPDGKRAYITILGSSGRAVSVLDTTTGTVTATIPLTSSRSMIMGIALTPDGKHAYVATEDRPGSLGPGSGGTVIVLDTTANTVTAKIPVDDFPMNLAITPDGKRAYVTTVAGVSVIDTASNKIDATMQIGEGPKPGAGRGIAITPNGQTAYMTSWSLNTVSVIDTITNKVRSTVEVGVHPVRVAVAPDGQRVFVTNEDSSNVSVIDTTTNTVSAIVDVGTNPRGVAITADGQRAYVTNAGSNSHGGPFDTVADTVSVIDTATNTVVDVVTVGASPSDIAIGPSPAQPR
jgi:YVTN family beta-propeller protein